MALKKHMLKIVLAELVICTAAGWYFHPLFMALKATLPAAIFAMIFQPMYALDLAAMRRGGHARRAKFLGLVLLMYAAIFPATAYVLVMGWRLALPPETYIILVGAVLVALAPVAMPAPAFVSMCGGDVELSVLSILVTFFASFIVMPVYALLLLHRIVHVPAGLLLKSLLMYIVAPFILGQILRHLVLRSSGKGVVGLEAYERVNRVLALLSLLGLYWLVGVVFGVAAPIILRNIVLTLIGVAILYLYFGGRFAIADVLGRAARLERRARIALIYAATGNGALGTAIALATFGPAATTGAVLAGPLVLVTLMILAARILSQK